MQDFFAATSIPAILLWVGSLLFACIALLVTPAPTMGSALVASSFCILPRSTPGAKEAHLFFPSHEVSPQDCGRTERRGKYTFYLLFQKIFKVSINTENMFLKRFGLATISRPGVLLGISQLFVLFLIYYYWI